MVLFAEIRNTTEGESEIAKVTKTFLFYINDDIKEILHELIDTPNKSSLIREKIGKFKKTNTLPKLEYKFMCFNINKEDAEFLDSHVEYGFRNASDFLQYILENQ